MTEATTHTSFVWRHIILSLSILDDSIIIKEHCLINLIAPCVVQASNVCWIQFIFQRNSTQSLLSLPSLPFHTHFMKYVLTYFTLFHTWIYDSSWILPWFLRPLGWYLNILFYYYLTALHWNKVNPPSSIGWDKLPQENLLWLPLDTVSCPFQASPYLISYIFAMATCYQLSRLHSFWGTRSPEGREGVWLTYGLSEFLA